MKKALLLLSLILGAVPAVEVKFQGDTLTPESAESFKEWVQLIKFSKMPGRPPYSDTILFELRLKAITPGVTSWTARVWIKNETITYFDLNTQRNADDGSVLVTGCVSPALRDSTAIFIEFLDNRPDQKPFRTFFVNLKDFPAN